MLDYRNRRDRRVGMLEKYTDQLGRIVDRRSAETALIIARQEAERAASIAQTAAMEADAANQAKTSFLANISHELRTPLNAIIGFSDIMRNSLFGPEDLNKYVEYATDINESGQHLLDLINDILDLAKVEAGRLELNEQDIDVDKVIRSCLTLVRERALENDLEIEQLLPSTPVTIYADERKFKQILINLLSNAIKFTPAKGKVSLRAHLDDAAALTIEIEDTGIGMAPEDIQKAMEPFTQVDSTLSRQYEGTGLGLPLTDALVTVHGGQLTLESAVGTGTKAIARFPAERTRNPSGTHS